MPKTKDKIKPCGEHSLHDFVIHQFMVVWKRVGLKEKKKVYNTQKGADRFMTLLGDKPWLAFTDDDEGEKYMCCAGRMENYCGCGGKTWKEYCTEKQAAMPPIEYVKLQTRIVGNWQDV